MTAINAGIVHCRRVKMSFATKSRYCRRNFYRGMRLICPESQREFSAPRMWFYDEKLEAVWKQTSYGASRYGYYRGTFATPVNMHRHRTRVRVARVRLPHVATIGRRSARLDDIELELM